MRFIIKKIVKGKTSKGKDKYGILAKQGTSEQWLNVLANGTSDRFAEGQELDVEVKQVGKGWWINLPREAREEANPFTQSSGNVGNVDLSQINAKLDKILALLLQREPGMDDEPPPVDENGYAEGESVPY